MCLMLTIFCMWFEICISGTFHHFFHFATSTPHLSPSANLPIAHRVRTMTIHQHHCHCPFTATITMSTDQKLQNKYNAANRRVGQWEARAIALRDGGDAEAYLEEQEDLFYEMVSARCNARPIPHG